MAKKRPKRVNTGDFTTALNGQPRRSPGRRPRRPEPCSPAQDLRQTRAFDLHVEGLSLREIAAQLGVHRKTVALDIQMESARRAYENAPVRMENQALSISRYEAVIARAFEQIAFLHDAAGIEPTSVYEVGTSVQCGSRSSNKCKRAKIRALGEATRTEHVIIDAQKQIDKLLGLGVPLSEGTVPPSPTFQQMMVFIVDLLPQENRIKFLNAISDKARELGVLPASIIAGDSGI